MAISGVITHLLLCGNDAGLKLWAPKGKGAIMKSYAFKIAFAVALFAVLVGTSRSSWATTTCGTNYDAAYSYAGPNTCFDLPINMTSTYPAGTSFVGMNFSLSFSPGADFDAGSTLNLVFYDASNDVIDTFDGYQIPSGTGVIGLGVGYGLQSATTVEVGYLQVTLTGDTAFDLDSDAGPVDAYLTPAPTPLPAALPLLATGLGAMGLFGWRRKQRARAAI